MAYTISSDKGKEIAKNLGTGKTYTASDGSTWKKESDGSVTVTEKNGAVHNNAYTSSSNKPLGADDKSWGTVNSSFEASKDVNKADKKSQNALSSLESLVNKEDIISDSVMNALNAQFVVPSAVTEADKYLAEQLGKIQSGKTSYSDQVRDMIDKIMNREKFSYDVDTDPLFQQALASAMNSGKQAMQDTIGQASALTGGYGSTYATTAGNQAYNAFIEDAYDNLPQYYQMAMEAYQMEGEEMYRQYSMLSTEDDKEYNRNVTAFDATSQYRNQIYNEAYTQYRDGINDAFAMANLQLNEHGQRVSDATNYYNATSNYSDKLYQREYNSWLDSINNAWKTIELGNNDYWNQSNQDFQASESEKNRDWQTTESQKQRDWQTTENQKDRNFQASENAKNRAASKSSIGSSPTSNIPSNISSKASKFETDAERADYLDSMVNSGYLTQDQADYLYESNMVNNQKPFNERTWVATSKGGLNWGLGIDKNGKVVDEYNNEYTLGDLWDEASKTMGVDEAETWIKKLQKELGITMW